MPSSTHVVTTSASWHGDVWVCFKGFNGDTLRVIWLHRDTSHSRHSWDAACPITTRFNSWHLKPRRGAGIKALARNCFFLPCQFLVSLDILTVSSVVVNGGWNTALLCCYHFIFLRVFLTETWTIGHLAFMLQWHEEERNTTAYSHIWHFGNGNFLTVDFLLTVRLYFGFFLGWKGLPIHWQRAGRNSGFGSKFGASAGAKLENSICIILRIFGDSHP